MDNLGQKMCWMLLGAAIAVPLTWWAATPISASLTEYAEPDSSRAQQISSSLPDMLSSRELPDTAQDKAELTALQQQVQQLQGELAQVKAHVDSASESSTQHQQAASSGNINRQLADIFRTELRDPVWADELELQLGDFLYTSDLSTYFAYASYGCKRHVCQLSFVPRSQDVDAMQWQRLNDSLFNSPWITHFKVSSAQQTAQGMQVHLSTKSIRQLNTEY
ncbi:hypothetical protein CWC22_016620 [Pseudoalteromonas rubra]|uniref:Uncharacterized protein n=1 Tax=Pseudoalteromonas rubra TaxID=43658 RepID=A0A5S3UVF3_9GAMM|nr:hypothetical protein [Pseudoalteromonas rubra]QPB84520.1 hypothetical protein CWC22_016620 [Pseudoalteromonas rubra]